MFPGETGAVQKRLVKDGTQTGLWHFGTSHEDFGTWFSQLIGHERWRPTIILITSLTSYWHVSIEKLLLNISQILGPKHRNKVQICLYGAYPRFEPEHAEWQYAADLAFTRSVDTTGCAPDHELYLKPPHMRLPNFAALDVRDASVHEHAEQLLELKDTVAKNAGNTRAQALTLAFFNEDVGAELDGLRAIAELVEKKSRSRITVHGICGIRAASLGKEALELMGLAGFRTLYVEHERTAGGGLDKTSYTHICETYRTCRRAHRRGEQTWLDRDGVTGFVNVGLPDDDMDRIVETTLELNEMFGSVIIKPWGWDPKVGPEERATQWEEPREASPQWYPYANNSSKLTTEDYQNLMRWQNILNTRVKGTTFDFLDDGTIARLVRETLTAESWKRHAT